jgi:hypothetical protein
MSKYVHTFTVPATCNITLSVLVTTNDTDISLGISELVIVNVIDGVESPASGSQELAPGELVSSKASQYHVIKFATCRWFSLGTPVFPH